MYPVGACRIIFHGALPGGEIWETGFWMTDTGVTDAGTANALADIVSGTLNSSDASGAMRILANQLWSSGTSWLETRVYAYLTASKKATVIGTYTLPAPRIGVGNPVLPNQCAAVLTMRTGLAGRQHRGRMYLPCNSPTLDANAEIPLQNTLAVVNAFATGFSDINASDTGSIVVVSDVGSAATPLSSVTMDTRVDIQRSRAKQQSISGRSSAPVTPHGS